MQNVSLIVTIATITLCAAQAALLCFRSVPCVSRSRPLLLAAALLCLSLLRALPAAGTTRLLILVSFLWMTGLFLAGSAPGITPGAVTGACAGILTILLSLDALGYGGTVPFAVLGAFGAALAASFSVRALIGVWRARGSPAALLTLVCACLWLMAGAVRLCVRLSGTPWPGLSDAAPAFLLSLCTGWLVFQEGYPLRAGWRGRLPALADGEGDTRRMAARLLENEAALEWQNRMIASGVLSLGAVHEFKNILSLVGAAAQHGLALTTPADKDECLRMVLDHAETARRSAVGSLELLASEGRERAVRIDAARDLPLIVGMLRPALRGQGIIMELDLASGVVFSARRGDVEQVIIGLVHNSAEAYAERGGGVITVAARQADGQAVIEVRDQAGGVAVGREHRLFAPASSGGDGTGLGLYLSRNLMLQNGGVLEYQPVDGGSVFRMSFPAEEGEPPQ
jgi:signal transduction histidine kinase